MAWPEMTFDGLSGRRGPPRPDLQSRVRSPTTPEEHGASEHRGELRGPHVRLRRDESTRS